ncbi:thermonuclease family protein [Actinomycetospora aeridis]|uniref:TNase-like domain-containing protein n=1 Tax=Actinomycetospora aeridis TaxID=3129231 RepID=A0ABU8N210_9PSEU
MRQAYKVWSGIAVGVFCLVAATDLSGGAGTPPAGTVASSSSLSATSTPSTPSSPSLSPGAPAAGATAPVLEVIDGDTFRLASGDEVRVLGIDSCEAATAGGRRATDAARARLLTAPVTLAAEPGVDRDRYGRMLRHVTAGGSDFAASMVAEDHTAIYTDGRNDASPAVQATLRRIDTNGRTCGATSTAPTTTRRTATPDADVDRPRTVSPRTATRRTEADSSGSSSSSDGGARRPRSGNSGHPCLPGERDGDRDGYCGEG